MDSANSAASARIELTNVSARFDGGDVLHSVSLTVEPGETVSLLGPSGCGKTTLLRAIAGLHPLRSGSIHIGDVQVSGPGVEVPAHRRKVGMVFQDGALFPHLTALENVAFGLKELPDAAARTERARSVLNLVGLGQFADRLPATLSGGQQQRVALARALAPRPSVLLLDEPFSALDAGMRTQIRRDVTRILADIGITAVVVTHDQDEAFALGDRVAAMDQGQIVQVGPATELYDRPITRWVAGFVGEANLVKGRCSGNGTVLTELGELPVNPASPAEGNSVEALVRPEHLVLAPGADGEIVLAEHYGHDALYEVAMSHGPVVVRTTDTAHSVGERVSVRFAGPPVMTWPLPEQS